MRAPRSRVPACATIALGLASGASVAAQVAKAPPVPETIRIGKDRYGPVQPAELQELATGMYRDRAVRTRGFLNPLDLRRGYYTLSEGGNHVVLIPAADYVHGVRSLAGRRVEVEGYVRRLHADQGTCRIPPDGRTAPASLCDNPELPPTPNLQGEAKTWPRMSITTWYVGEIDGGETTRARSREWIADALEAGAASGRPVRVVGRFCGVSLCGSLGAPPVPSAWALDDGVAGVWVIGKEPRGKGWKLDPRYAGDSTRWLEVVGQVEPCGTTRCLKAKSLALVPRPATAEPPP